MKNAYSNMANPIGQRLKFEMKKRGINSAELAKRADVKTSFIYDVISGKSANPSTVKLARVVESLGISLSQLVDNGAEKIAAAKTGNDYVALQRLSVEMSGSSVNVISVNTTGEAALFHKGWIAEHLGVSPAALRILTIRGDSMEPNLQHNDLLLVDTTQTSPSSPGIFVLFDGMGLAVKRLEYSSQSLLNQAVRIKVISDNPHYSVYERSVADISIIGRVVWFSRSI